MLLVAVTLPRLPLWLFALLLRLLLRCTMSTSMGGGCCCCWQGSCTMMGHRRRGHCGLSRPTLLILHLHLLLLPLLHRLRAAWR